MRPPGSNPEPSVPIPATAVAAHVVLVRAPVLFSQGSANNEAVPHLAYAYLSAYLREAGFKVTIVDAIAEGLNRVVGYSACPGTLIQGLSVSETVQRIPADASIIGFSCMFSAEWLLNRDLVQQTRARFPDALLVAGGEHVTALPEYSLRDCPALDVIVKGEGEATMLAVCLNHTQHGDFGQVPGTCYLDQGQTLIDRGGLPRIRQVDALPWPQWPEGYLEKFWSAGKSYGIRHGRDIPILASRGCPYQCTFCSSPSMWTTRYVLRDIDDLMAEIEHYVERYQVDSIQFYDLTAITKKRWTVAFAKRLIESGLRLKWSLPSGTRSEILDEEVLTLLRESGCDYMAYAPESGSPRTLKRIKKRVRLDRMIHSIRTAKRLGFTVRTNLIIGFPEETRSDVWQTIRFGLSMAWLGVDEVPLWIYSSYPGTEIFEELRAQGKIELNDDYFLSLVSFNGKFSALNPPGISNQHLFGFELGLYRLGFTLLNYLVGYLRFPGRIWRTLRNLRTGREAATVFENRMQDAMRRTRVG